MTAATYLAVAACEHCSQPTIWIDQVLVYPIGAGPAVNPDLYPAAAETYAEALKIADLSPRSAAAMLRLAIQQTVEQYLTDKDVEPSGNLNDDIGALAKDGINDRVVSALDVVRVIGNNAVHPGQIDVAERPEVVGALFYLVNRIAEQLITEPKQTEAMFEGLPEGQKEAARTRDADAPGGHES